MDDVGQLWRELYDEWSRLMVGTPSQELVTGASLMRKAADLVERLDGHSKRASRRSNENSARITLALDRLGDIEKRLGRIEALLRKPLPVALKRPRSAFRASVATDPAPAARDRAKRLPAKARRQPQRRPPRPAR